MANFSKMNLPANAEKGFDLDILDPYGDKTDAVFTIRGVKSKVVRDFMISKMKEDRKAEKARKGKKEDDDLSLEQIENLDATMAEVTANRVITFKNVTETNADGVEVVVEPTPENILRLMNEHEWIRAQILEASNELKNFRSE